MFFTCSDDKKIIAWDNNCNKLGVIEGPSACKSIALSYNTEFIVGAFATEGFEIFDVMTGTKLRKVKTKDRVMNVEFNFGDTELATVNLATASGSVNTYDFKTLLGTSSDYPVPKCLIEF
jgi:WD40 repeat protein